VADLSDEMLMAYADGRLDPVTREVVKAAMRGRPEYREKVEKFRQTLMPIRHAFDDEPASERAASLIEQMHNGDSGLTDGVADKLGTTRRGNAVAGEASLLPAGHWPIAIAASIALLIGVGLGWILQPREALTRRAQDMIAFGDRGLVAQGALRDLLETARSGTTMMAEGAGKPWRLRASFTFRSYTNAFCRRYEMADAAGARFGGYACRSGGGQWLVQAHVKSEATIQDRNGFAPSAGHSDAGLDAAIDVVRDGDVLEPALESGLIESGWRDSQG
jgi:hypothetical protein